MTAPAIPLTVTQLENLLLGLSAEIGIPAARARILLGTLVVSQLLPRGTFIKGGMGMKVLLGEVGTRATSDLDLSNAERGPRWAEEFAKCLDRGWGGVPASKGERKREPLAPNRVAVRGTLKAKKSHEPGLEKPSMLFTPTGSLSLTSALPGWGWTLSCLTQRHVVRPIPAAVSTATSSSSQRGEVSRNSLSPRSWSWTTRWGRKSTPSLTRIMTAPMT